MACIKLKKLKEYLQNMDGFEKPKVLLEQYLTPDHIASHMLYTIQTNYNDIENKCIADLGSGCGMLTIGACLLGAQFTVGFEIDKDAIQIFQNNVNDMELKNIDCIQCNILEYFHNNNNDVNDKWNNFFDTIILNPPFGTKHNAGMDIKFLSIAIKLAKTAVYSLHKTSTREFIRKKTQEWGGVESEVIAELRYNLDASYKFHKKKSVDIEVDCWRINVTNKKL